MNSALLFETFYGVRNISARELLNDLLKRWVLLPHDLIQPCKVHSCLLQLLIGPTSFNSLVLTLVPHKDYAVLVLHSMEELIHLPRAGKARFVQNVKTPLINLLATAEMALQ